ncbi:MAG: hypothetical protein EWM72_03346 [Nitrospira sp.]|nr:MAG: hypothetical protein EWM72_03346 [Nitrospira sp.]
MDRYEPLFESDRSNEIKEEGLSRSELANDKPNSSAAVSDSIQVGNESLNLFDSANLEMLLASPRHDSCPK